jgi:Sec-independent protein translocase protein TatA
LKLDLAFLLNKISFMTTGISQFLLIFFVMLLLFGNLTNFLKDLAKGINNFKETLKKSNLK